MFVGLEAREVNLEDELTVLIDTKKYLEIFQRSSEASNCAENEVYQECGSKCVLGCRNASSSVGITLSSDECEKTECVKGCFCKDGLVRHRDKCIPIAECSERNGKAVGIESVVVFDAAPMKIFGFLRPQQCGAGGCSSGSSGVGGCGPGGCSVAASPQNCGPKGCGIYIYNHNEAINEGTENNFLKKIHWTLTFRSCNFSLSHMYMKL